MPLEESTQARSGALAAGLAHIEVQWPRSRADWSYMALFDWARLSALAAALLFYPLARLTGDWLFLLYVVAPGALAVSAVGLVLEARRRRVDWIAVVTIVATLVGAGLVLWSAARVLA